MEISAKVETKFDITFCIHKDEMFKLLEEMESLFIRSAGRGEVQDYSKIFELKNMLTLSTNNS